MADIFISYAREDRSRAAVLALALRRTGWTVFWDKAILPGAIFAERIERELQQATSVLVLWSAASLDSDWVKREAAVGASRRVLIPALIDPVGLPAEYADLQFVDLTNWDGRSADERFRALTRAISERKAPDPGTYADAVPRVASAVRTGDILEARVEYEFPPTVADDRIAMAVLNLDDGLARLASGDYRSAHDRLAEAHMVFQLCGRADVRALSAVASSVALERALRLEGDDQSALQALDRVRGLLDDATLLCPRFKGLAYAIKAESSVSLATQRLQAGDFDSGIEHAREAAAQYRFALDASVDQVSKRRAAGDLYDWEVLSAALTAFAALDHDKLEIAGRQLHGANGAASALWAFLSNGPYDGDARISEVIVGVYVVITEIFHFAARARGYTGPLWLSSPPRTELVGQLRDLEQRARSIGQRGAAMVDIIQSLGDKADRLFATRNSSQS